MRSHRLRFVAALAVIGVVAASPGSTASAREKPNGSITVFAAASLTEAFTKIGTDFEKQYPGTTITFSFNSSSTLATQVEEGAPADVFASADETNMDKLVGAGSVAGKPKVFARNRLEIAVEPGNPKKIRSLADTVADDVILVLCAPEVPCGKYALEAYERAGVTVPTGPTAENAKATLSKVVLGEADAAVVYITDVAAGKGDVDGVKIPAGDNIVAVYPIAPLADVQNEPLANAFVKYVASKKGRRALQRFGFRAP